MKLFDGIIISKIDLDKTTQNGKNICDLYQPLVEKRLKQAKNTPFNSASFVMFSGNQKGGNSSEVKSMLKLYTTLIEFRVQEHINITQLNIVNMIIIILFLISII